MHTETMSRTMSDSSHRRICVPYFLANAASTPNRNSRQAASVRKNVDALTSSAPAASTNGVNGNGGGMRSSTASASAPLRRTRFETSLRDVSLESLLSDQDAHPECQPRAGERSARREQGHEPCVFAQLRGEDDDDGINPEWKREEQRRIERPENDDASDGGKEPDDPARERTHRPAQERAMPKPMKIHES